MLRTYEKFTMYNFTNKLLNLFLADIDDYFDKHQKDKDFDYYHFNYKPVDLKEVKYLLDNGADIDVKDGINNYGSILSMAVYRQDVDAIKFLIEHGADINKTNSVIVTALYISASFNSLILKILIDAGADVNIANSSGVLPIHSALYAKNFESAILLLKSGSNVSTKQYTINTWLKGKNLEFQKELFNRYPVEFSHIDRDNICKKLLDDYDILQTSNKYNI